MHRPPLILPVQPNDSIRNAEHRTANGVPHMTRTVPNMDTTDDFPNPPEKPRTEMTRELRAWGGGRAGGQPFLTHRSPFENHKKASSTTIHNVPPNMLATPSQASYRQQKRPRIQFYHKHDPYYGFTNFSPHPVNYKNKLYPTSEHLFQSFKFQDDWPKLAEHIRTCSPLPGVAFSEARRFQPQVRPDWKQVNVAKMDETLLHKFEQHLDLREELLDTGDAELVEDSDKDAFWGIGPDGKGSNELGKALERLRAKFRKT